MPANNTQAIDIDGTEEVSVLVLNLINAFPGLNGKTVKFSELSDSSGISVFPTSGAVLTSSKESITGCVKQECAYPFDLVYRVAPKNQTQRLKVKALLDSIGKWLELQSVTVNDDAVKLEGYPSFSSGNRKITSIDRSTSGYCAAAYQDGVEDWKIKITLKYDNEFEK